MNTEPAKLAESFEELLAKHGVPVGEVVQSDEISTIRVGCSWCDCSLAFDVTIPKIFGVLVDKIRDTFSGYDVDVSDWSHLGEHGAKYIHIIAWVA